jgi:hypothetical protein
MGKIEKKKKKKKKKKKEKKRVAPARFCMLGEWAILGSFF